LIPTTEGEDREGSPDPFRVLPPPEGYEQLLDLFWEGADFSVEWVRDFAGRLLALPGREHLHRVIREVRDAADENDIAIHPGSLLALEEAADLAGERVPCPSADELTSAVLVAWDAGTRAARIAEEAAAAAAAAAAKVQKKKNKRAKDKERKRVGAAAGTGGAAAAPSAAALDSDNFLTAPPPATAQACAASGDSAVSASTGKPRNQGGPLWEDNKDGPHTTSSTTLSAHADTAPATSAACRGAGWTSSEPDHDDIDTTSSQAVLPARAEPCTVPTSTGGAAGPGPQQGCRPSQ
jgi:hypothetical protein